VGKRKRASMNPVNVGGGGREKVKFVGKNYQSPVDGRHDGLTKKTPGVNEKVSGNGSEKLPNSCFASLFPYKTLTSE